MQTKSILTPALLTCGILLAMSAAQAQTLNLVLNPVLNTGATGTYDVMVTELTPTTFSVEAQGVNNGLGGAAKHNGDEISYTFVGDTIASDSGHTGAAWVASGIGGDTAFYSSPGVSNDLDSHGATPFFNGSAGLGSAFGNGGLIKVALQDGGQQWNNQGNLPQLTPESSSLALIVAAFLPLLFIARRKRSTGDGPLAA